ncbi:cell death abnormality protein 1-like [Ostrea edulis]|uniref:cell death abnormality protein 1-like n=1 Tax=Ostrea edulis TaxID=37623 RepID=UPI0024AF31E2|nr:cell death abnormality protein 1-like [Ostrea edulis]
MLKNGKCIECPPGKFGKSCSKNCPDGYYGKFCSSKCTCFEGQICHYKKGCIQSPERSKANYDACLQNEPRMGNRSCCVNERTVGKQCQECWRGRFGKDCKYPCPVRRYGRFCLGTCNCTTNEICNREMGCILIKSESF